MTSHTVVPEIALTGNAFGVKKLRRNVETRTYEAHVSDDAAVPDSPVNPGRLSPVGWKKDGPWTMTFHWVCESMELTRSYGEPLSGIYREVWTLHGQWEMDTE